MVRVNGGLKCGVPLKGHGWLGLYVKRIVLPTVLYGVEACGINGRKKNVLSAMEIRSTLRPMWPTSGSGI